MNNTVNMNENSNVVHGEFRRGLLARIIDQITTWNERRVAIRQLNMLSDRMLNDIGIERFQISSVVKQPGSFVSMNAERTSQPTESAVIREAA